MQQRGPFYHQPMNYQRNYPYGEYPNIPYPQQEMNYSQAPMFPNAQFPENEPMYPNKQTSNQPLPITTPFDYYQKPEQPMNWPNNIPYEATQYQQQPQANPNVMASFQKENGQLDLDKVLNTVGQLANTYHQVAPIFQQFGAFMKNFRGGS